MNDQLGNDSSFNVVIVARNQDLGDNFEVCRILLSRERRMVGPFVSLDQMGPHLFFVGHGLDACSHPYIGLATITYLFDEEIIHRDSLDIKQTIGLARKWILHSYI